MKASEAQDIAERIVTALAPACERIEMAGSLRRRRADVHDIDLVLIPRDRLKLLILLLELYGRKPEKIGEKYVMLKSFDGIQVDLYLATPATWVTLLLIRTGSKAHNIMLCTKARRLGMTLHADGRGLEELREPFMVPIESEEEIFQSLHLPYREPWEREC